MNSFHPRQESNYAPAWIHRIHRSKISRCKKEKKRKLNLMSHCAREFLSLLLDSMKLNLQSLGDARYVSNKPDLSQINLEKLFFLSSPF